MPGNTGKLSGIQRIDTDIQAIQTGVVPVTNLLWQPIAIGGQRHGANAVGAFADSDQFGKVGTQSRFTTGQTDLAGAQPGKRRDNDSDFICTKKTVGHAARRRLIAGWQTITAAEIADIRYRQAQITEPSAITVL